MEGLRKVAEDVVDVEDAFGGVGWTGNVYSSLSISNTMGKSESKARHGNEDDLQVFKPPIVSYLPLGS